MESIVGRNRVLQIYQLIINSRQNSLVNNELEDNCFILVTLIVYGIKAPSTIGLEEIQSKLLDMDMAVELAQKLIECKLSMSQKGQDVISTITIASNSLVSLGKLNEANDVIITGSSAGGLTSILHADHIADKIREKNHKNPNIAAIPDAGYFMDYPSIDGEYKLADEFSFKDMYNFQNIAASSSSALAACRDTYDNKNTAFKCLFPQYIMPFIRTPIFFTQSFADSYQFPNVMGMDPHASGSDVVKYVDKFRSTMLHSMSNGPSETGYWLTGCRMHTLEYHSDWYTDKDINGMQMRYAMYGWYQDTFVHKKPVKWRYVDKPWSNGEPSNC